MKMKSLSIIKEVKPHNPLNVTFRTLKNHSMNGNLRHSRVIPINSSNDYKPDDYTTVRYLKGCQGEPGNKILSQDGIKITLVNNFHKINFLVVKPV